MPAKQSCIPWSPSSCLLVPSRIPGRLLLGMELLRRLLKKKMMRSLGVCIRYGMPSSPFLDSFRERVLLLYMTGVADCLTLNTAC